MEKHLKLKVRHYFDLIISDLGNVICYSKSYMSVTDRGDLGKFLSLVI